MKNGWIDGGMVVWDSGWMEKVMERWDREWLDGIGDRRVVSKKFDSKWSRRTDGWIGDVWL